jgi:hypothetical protein
MVTATCPRARSRPATSDKTREPAMHETAAPQMGSRFFGPSVIACVRGCDTVRSIRHYRIGRIGGEGEIRTHEGLAPLPVFKTGAFNRSATSPARETRWLGVNYMRQFRRGTSRGVETIDDTIERAVSARLLNLRGGSPRPRARCRRPAGRCRPATACRRRSAPTSSP